MQDVRDNKVFSKISVIGGGLLIILAIGIIGYMSLQKSGYFLDRQNKDKNKIASVKYFCENKKTLTADFFESKNESSDSVSSTNTENTNNDTQDPSIPNPLGSVVVKLDDGRNFDLKQTISADGGRYANQDESFVFWEKGEEVMILEFDTEKMYKNCKKNMQIMIDTASATPSIQNTN